MSTDAPALLVVTGLQREAAIAAADGVVTVCSGSDPALLQEKLSTLSRPHPEEAAKQPSRRMGPPSSFETGATRRPQDEGGDRLATSIRAVLSFGLAGGLAPHLRPGDFIIASQVLAGNERQDVHSDWCEVIASKVGSVLRVHRGAIAGHDTVLTRSSDKAALHMATGALAVDMESHIAAEYARRHGLPFAAIRAISDPATRSLPAIATDALTQDGGVALGKVMKGLLRQPGQFPALIAAGIDSERAFASLRRCRRSLGPLFGLGGANLR